MWKGARHFVLPSWSQKVMVGIKHSLHAILVTEGCGEEMVAVKE